jgi:quercetin dioxygenase-like cupin family protein
MIEGAGTLEIDGERYPLRASEGIVFDPQKLHGLVNSSDVPMRYIVILTKD